MNETFEFNTYNLLKLIPDFGKQKVIKLMIQCESNFINNIN